MPNTFFQFKQFIIHQDRTAMKVTTDSCLFGAWTTVQLANGKFEILDIGAGTGLLSMMIAQKLNDVRIDAIEIDEEAYRQAKENVEASPWADRINVIHGDIGRFQSLGKYDVIVSNPPFYESELKGDDPKKNLAHHEGLSFSELINAIRSNLKPGGRFYLLLPFKRSKEMRQMLMKQGLSTLQMFLVKQSVNHDYFRLMLEGTNERSELPETSFDEIAIMNEGNEYTPEFVQLLKDYYLYL